MALTPALRFDGVSYAYHAMPSPALAGVSFSLAAGERAALLGRNGAGKSTLVRLVTGLLQPAAGVIWVGDWDTRGRAPEELARRVASVFQHADQQLFARTVRDDVGFGPCALGLAPADAARRTADALDALELAPYADQHPYDLPPAFRKLAALACDGGPARARGIGHGAARRHARPRVRRRDARARPGARSRQPGVRRAAGAAARRRGAAGAAWPRAPARRGALRGARPPRPARACA